MALTVFTFWSKNKLSLVKIDITTVIGITNKVGLSPSKKNYFTCFNENTLKMMTNLYYFILKALFVINVFKFFSCYFGDVGETT